MLWPREAGRFIAERAKDVSICLEGIKSCAKAIASAVEEKKLDIDTFKHNEFLPLDKGLTAEQLANWIFIVDALNFSFWTKKDDPKFQITVNGKKATGYLAMLNAISRAIDEGKPMYDPSYYSKLTLDDMKCIFRSDTQSSMPLLEKRVEVAAEVGNILVKQFEGTFLSVLKRAEGSAMKLLDVIITHFPCFRDVHSYDGKEVAILKRPQIVIADLVLLYRGKGLGKFYDADKLTMFADYRVPQVLVHFGALKYSDRLLEKLQDEHLFECGEREEVEIRGASIHATELIVAEVKLILGDRKMSNAHVNSMKVDFFLWDFRAANAEALESIPFHKTRCVFY